MIGTRFSGMAVRKSKFAVSDPVAPAFKGRQRRPEWQTSRASVYLGGQYPIMVCYVNLFGRICRVCCKSVLGEIVYVFVRMVTAGLRGSWTTTPR